MRAHEKSKCHSEAVLKIFTLPSTTHDIGETLSSQHKQEKFENRQCFIKIMSCIQHLARQGLPLRGDKTEADANFVQLLELQSKDNPNIVNWLQRKTNKYTSPEVQNEILKVMALQVLREIVKNLQNSPFYTIMVDETTDVSNREQVVLCLRWVDERFDVHEEFTGLYTVDNISANTLVAVIKDALLRMNLTLNKVRGQCYDGAANMAGVRSGVAKQIIDEEPRAVYTHCYGHALNLACGDTIRKCTILRDALDVTYEITKLIKLSPCRECMFEKLKQSTMQTPDSTGIRSLCPTRWTVKADALKSIIENYGVLQDLWDESVDVVRDSEMKARILGVAAQMKTFEYFYAINLAELILRHSDNLSRTLQKTNISAAEGQDVASLTVKTLLSSRSEEKFACFWKYINHLAIAKDLEVDDPKLPRRRKRPKRYESGLAEAEFPTSVEGYYRKIYFEAIDLVTNCIKDRFDQPGFRVYRHLQDLLLKAAKHTDYQEELEFVSRSYGQDLDCQMLKIQLEQYAILLDDNNIIDVNIEDVFAFMKGLSLAQKSLLSEVCKLNKLVLVMPATNAVSERSFSALRRVKGYSIT